MRSAYAAVAAFAFVASACAEDLTLVNGAWDTLSKGWGTAVAEGKKANEGLAAQLAGVVIKADDVAGKGLQKTADDALAAHKKVLADMDQVISETSAAIAKVQEQKKILPVQQAIDSGTKAWTELSAKLAPAAQAATEAVNALVAHAKAEADKAAAAAADPALKDPETVKAKDGVMTVALTFTDKNAVDEAASAAGLDRITKILSSCDALQIEATASGTDDKAGKARADAVKKLFDTKGLKNKIATTAGAAGEGPVSLKVTTPCP